MNIKSTYTTRLGKVFDLYYYEQDPLMDLDGKILDAVHAYCFYHDKLVIVYNKDKNIWTPPGGGIESGESIEEAVVREVKEEANMRILRQTLIGYQDIHEPGYIHRQIRSCCIVEPFGDFVADPDGDVTAIKLIDPKDYNQYFGWGIVGDRIMERAIALKGSV